MYTRYHESSPLGAFFPGFPTLVKGYFTKKAGTVGHKSHDSCFHKKYVEVEVMTFAAHCIIPKFSDLFSVAIIGSILRLNAYATGGSDWAEAKTSGPP